MARDQEEQPYTILLTLLAVRMKVKFPCRMVIEWNGKSATGEVAQGHDGRFVFNQELRLREEGGGMSSEMNVCLVTDKGARYISGVVKLYQSEMIRKEGQKTQLGLSKCLDPQATIELRVEKVIREGRTKRLTSIPELSGLNIKTAAGRLEDHHSSSQSNNYYLQGLVSPRRNQNLTSQTRSEAYLQTSNHFRARKDRDDYQRSKDHQMHLPTKRLSPKRRGHQSKSKFLNELSGQFDRQRMIEAQVYRDNYNKLKQKYLKEAQVCKNEASKRLMLESNENNFKLQIVRLKLRAQQLQKALNDKNHALRELNSRLTKLQGVESDVGCLREQITNKEHAIRIMEDTIITLSKENDDLRNNNKEMSFGLEQKIIVLENEVQSLNQHIQTQADEHQRQGNHWKEVLQQKEQELSRKNDLLEKQKQTVHQLEKSIQARMFEHDSVLHQQRTQVQSMQEQNKAKLDELTQSLNKTQGEKTQFGQQLERLKGALLKNEYEYKLAQQELATLRGQTDQLKLFRDRYNETAKDLRIISEQKNIIEKNHERTVTTKEALLEEMTQEYKKELQYQKRNGRQNEERYKISSAKLIETEGQLEINKGQLDKTKKSLQGVNKQLIEVKQREKGLKKALKVKEEEYDELRKESIRAKEKSQATNDGLKTELGRLREDYGRTKISLEAQVVKNEQLTETNSELNLQLGRYRMSLQFSEEKQDKYACSVQQKYIQFEKIIKEHQNVIELLEDKIKAQKGVEKEQLVRLQKSQYQIGLVIEKNQRLIRELKGAEERIRQSEGALRGKEGQVIESGRRISELEGKVQRVSEETEGLRQKLQTARHEVDKTKRILEIMEVDFSKAKEDVLSQSHKLTAKQRQIEEHLSQLRRDKETIITLQGRQTNLKREYLKFKESVSQAMSNSFSQVMQSLASGDKQSRVLASAMGSVSDSKKEVNELGRDLISAITHAGRQNKSEVARMGEKIRGLERQIDQHKAELVRAQQGFKRQLSEKGQFVEQLEFELKAISNERGQTENELQWKMTELADRLQKSQQECGQLTASRQQLQYQLAGVRLEHERAIEQYDKALGQLRHDRNQAEQKLEYQYHTSEMLQRRVHEAEVELMNINQILMLQKEQTYKKDLQYSEVLAEKDGLVSELEVVRRSLKKTQQKVAEIDIQLATTREAKEKYESMLGQEEGKLRDVRAFNTNILRQKEDIIRKELERGMEVSNLETSIVELGQEVQSRKQEAQKWKGQAEESREQTRRLSGQVRDLEAQVEKEQVKYGEIREKLRGKQQRLVEIRDESDQLRKRVEEHSTKSKTSIEELRQENEMLSRQLEAINAQSQDKQKGLEAQLVKSGQQLQASKEEVGQLEEALFVERENVQAMQDSLTKLRNELDEVRVKAEQLEKAYVEAAEQNREKDEQMYELGGKLYEYQSHIRQLEEEKQRELEEVTTSLNLKYDEDYQQIYQKIEFIDKEKEYFKEKCAEKEEQISRKNDELRQRELSEAELKRAFEDKIKKLQEQKLHVFSEKNKELSKAMQDNKSQFQSLRGKESENRKTTHELQISRTTIQKLEGKIKEVQNERSSQLKAYQSELETLRKKDLTAKSYRDQVRSAQWTCEREVRKHIQAFLKRVLEGGRQQVRNESLVGLVKGLQEGVLSAVGAISNE